MSYSYDNKSILSAFYAGKSKSGDTYESIEWEFGTEECKDCEAIVTRFMTNYTFGIRPEFTEHLRHLYETPYQRFCRQFIDEIRADGLHEDNIERIQYVFEFAPKSIENYLAGAIQRGVTIDMMVQVFLEVYSEITKG